EGLSESPSSQVPYPFNSRNDAIAAVERHRALEHVPGLVLLDMDVARDGVVGGHCLVEHGEPPLGLGAAGLALQERADKPVSLSLPVGERVNTVGGSGLHGDYLSAGSSTRKARSVMIAGTSRSGTPASPNAFQKV